MRTARQVGRLALIGLALVALGVSMALLTARRAFGLRLVRPVSHLVGLQRDPAKKKPGESMKIGGLSVTVWTPSQPPGPSPLIIFSHGFHGSSQQSTFLMMELASHGYLVIAPNHRDATLQGGLRRSRERMDGFSKPADWTEKSYKDRGEDIKDLIADLKADRTWSKQIDWKRVGLAGHSLGGYTVLGLAGAWPSWKLPDVKAVLALSPYCSPYVQKETLKGITVPVMYQGGTRDLGITPSVQRKNGAYDQTGHPAYFVDFQGAGHLAWTDLQKPYQDSIEAYSVAFFDRYLKGDRSANLTSKRSDVVEIRSK